MLNNIAYRINETISNLQTLLLNKGVLQNIEDVTQLIATAIKSGNKLMICGNGAVLPMPSTSLVNLFVDFTKTEMHCQP